MTRLRVLHVISEMGVGGAETLVAELVRRGRTRGWTSAVASSGGVRADDLAAEGVALHRVPPARRSPVGVLRAALATARAVRRSRPDVVLAHNVGATVVARLAARGRVPVVTVFHGVAEEDYPRAAALLARHAGAVVAVSVTIARRLRDAGLDEPAPVVIRNAVAARPAASRATVRQALGITPTAPVVLCLARHVPQKRLDLLVDAWARLTVGPSPRCDPSRDPVLLLAGDGPLRSELERLAAARGVTGSVRFLGSRDDVPDLLAAADVSVLTSDWEGLPVAVLESLAAGVPVVASDVDGVTEVLTRGAGRLVPPGDAGAVAAALGELLGDRAARVAAGEEARRIVARDHDPDAMLARYEHLLTRGRPAPRPVVGRRTVTVGLAVLAALLVGGASFSAIAFAPAEFQGRIGLIAGPAGGDDASTAQFGEVVQLGMPAVAELVRTPAVLDAAAAGTGVAPAELADTISVEYLPSTGVARIAVRAGTAQQAGDLAVAVARGVVDADLLAPVADLRLLDGRADVAQVGPDVPLALGLALVAGSVAGVGALALRHLARPSTRGRLRIADALALAGASHPVIVLDAADPDLVGRLAVLQRAAARPLRVIGTGPGTAGRVDALTGDLRAGGATLQVNGHADRAAVVALLDRSHTEPDDVTAAVGALPDVTAVVAVVLS